MAAVAMGGLIDSSMPWQERFAQLAGRSAEDAGVKTISAANDYLLRLQEMRQARPANITIDPVAVADSWGKTGAVGQGTGSRPTK